VGWIYPIVFYFKYHKYTPPTNNQYGQINFDDVKLLRANLALNISAPFIVSISLSLLSKTLVSHGAVVYWISAIFLWFLMERFVLSLKRPNDSNAPDF